MILDHILGILDLILGNLDHILGILLILLILCFWLSVCRLLCVTFFGLG